MSIIIFIVILLVLVLVHEFGHFFTAKKFGIRVDEFGFGFPPKLFGFKKGETEYSLNALPIGGFVKIFGENPDEESTNGPDRERSFVHKPKWQQAIVLFAGVFMNFILAWILFSITLFMGSPLAADSIPTVARQQMTERIVVLGIAKDSPAQRAGLQAGDFIVSLETNKEKISSPTLDEFIAFTNKPGETIHFTYFRNGAPIFVDIIPEENVSLGRAFIGLAPGTLISGRFNLFESLNYGLQTAWLTSRDTVIGLKKLIFGGPESKAIRDSIIGPVGLAQVTGAVFNIGVGYLLSFAGLISVSLAVINLVPFPALDGGRLLFLLIEKIKGSRINPKFTNTANLIGFGVLIFLMMVVTFNDVVKLF